MNDVGTHVSCRSGWAELIGLRGPDGPAPGERCLLAAPWGVSLVKRGL